MLFLALLVVAPVAASNPDPKHLVLRLQDMPTGFQSAGATSSPSPTQRSPAIKEGERRVNGLAHGFERKDLTMQGKTIPTGLRIRHSRQSERQPQRPVQRRFAGHVLGQRLPHGYRGASVASFKRRELPQGALQGVVCRGEDR